ncbi:MAG: uroporphyrinogen decarboxylase family protein [Anaerolineae bacterium]
MQKTITSPQTALTPLPADYRADWEDIRIALLRLGEPAWVPFMEAGIDASHKRRILGRPVRTLADDLEVSRRLGQPFIVINIGLHTHPAVIEAMEVTHVEVENGRAGDTGWVHAGQRRWAQAGIGTIATEEDFENFPWPDADGFDYSLLDEAERLLPANFRVIFALGKVFNLGWWLMGFTNYAYALADNPGLVERLHARIAAIQMGVMERALAYRCVGLVWHADDMAYRTGLMVSPAVLRRQIFPAYARMNAVCRQQGVLTVFHSDGKMDDLMEDIIAAGFDAFNPIEPVAMDIRALKQWVQGRLSLIGNVDLSYTLTMGTPAEVEAEVYGLIRDLAPGGGYALASANSIPEYVPWENFAAMHAAWVCGGRYPIRM